MFIFFLSVLSCICHMGVIGSCTVEDCINHQEIFLG